MTAHARSFSLTVKGLLAVALLGVGVWAYLAYAPKERAIGMLGCFSECSGVAGACRDGALTAVDEFNATRGGNAPEVRLIVRDARGDVAAHVREMVDAGAVAIVGPTCRGCLLPTVAAANNHGIVLLSPVLADEAPGTRATNLISTYPKAARRYEYVARHLHGRKQVREMAIFVGVQGAAAGAIFRTTFEGIDEANRGTIYATRAEDDTNLRLIAGLMLEQSPGAVMLLADPVHNGILAQHLRQQGYGGLLVTDEFLVTREYIAFGGSAVEETMVFSTFHLEHSSDRYRSFRDRFARRFGYEPNAAAVHSYDATRILLTTMAESVRPSDLRDLLLAKQTYAGMQDRIVLSADGDVRREIYPVVLRQGGFTAAK